MAFKITEWELSDIPDDEVEGTTQARFSEGLHIVKVIDAAYEDANTAETPENVDTYRLTIESVGDDGAKANLRYWVKNKERTAYNENVVGTLNSLGKAVFGSEFTKRIPAPCDIVGAVVGAEIKYGKPTATGKTYPRVYHWAAVPSAYAVYSDIEQYYTQQ